MRDIKIKIDGQAVIAQYGQTILEAATNNGIYIPTLCHYKDLNPQASCRICSVMVNGRPTTACTTPVAPGMEIENDTPEINELRKTIVETMFVKGNHFCPSCEKSGNCELQALAYRFKMDVPRFEYSFNRKKVEAANNKIMIDHERCIKCKRCARSIKTEDGRNFFAFANRAQDIRIQFNSDMENELTDELLDKAVEVCPVGAIIKKGQGFIEPIGTRKYDNEPIGSDIEKRKEV